MQSLFKRLTNYDDPNSYGSRLRARRAKRIIDLIEECYADKGSCTVLDVGGTERYWNIIPREFLSSRNVRITLLNLTAIDLKDSSGLFASVAGDGCDLSNFGTSSVDVVHSNSVIEHVGLWDAMQAMAGEVRRVGRAYYLQTPYFWFPVEPHYFGIFLHWLPLSWRVKIAMRMSLGHSPRADSVAHAVQMQQSAQLLDVAMMHALFPDATHYRERWFGLTKSLIAVRHSSLPR